MIQKRFRKLAPAAIALFAVSLLGLAFASAASAGEKLYWSNYDNGSIAFSGIDGSGGGQLNTDGAEIDDSEGMSIDTATGRLFWSSLGSGAAGAIFFANLDGSGGGGQLNTAGAPVDTPIGVAVDPSTRTIYWANLGDETEADDGSIGWARLDGSGGGQFNAGGVPVANPTAIALDLAGGRIFWANNKVGEVGIAYTRFDGSGGGALDTSPETILEGPSGLAIDPNANRIYWSEPNEDWLAYADLNGGGGGSLDPAAATIDEPYGLAFDPLTSRVYVGNYGNGEERDGGISFFNAGGGGGDLTLAPPASVAGPQDPVILRGPSGLTPPLIGGSSANGSILTCSQGTWAADFAGSYTYRAPHTYAYQWSLNGVPIAAATAATVAATQGGSYACTVTAANAAGSAAQVSAPFAVAGTVKVTKLKLNKKKGIATLFAKVSGPGAIVLTGKKVVKRKATAKKAGVVKLIVKGKGKAKKGLRKHGKAKVKATVTFTAQGGVAASKGKKITLKKKAKKKHHHGH
jgi:hypothetical protein